MSILSTKLYLMVSKLFLYNDSLRPQNPGSGTPSNNQNSNGSITNSRFNLTSDEVMTRVLTVIGYIGTFLGIGLTVVGIFQLLMALKDHDGDSKSKAINYVIAGVAFFSLGIILNQVFLTE